jgi:hypothetical protein
VSDDDDIIVPNQTEPTNELTELMLITFWSVIQLEGDIHAELDYLTNSGLASTIDSKDGRSVRLPNGLVGVPGGEQLEMNTNKPLQVGFVMLHFYAQLSIRRILNRAHEALYGIDKDDQSKADRHNGLGWKDSTPETLWLALQAWRGRLPLPLQWNDHEPPSPDVLQARLRAKYYGAAYIITRKHLYSALYDSKVGEVLVLENGNPSSRELFTFEGDNDNFLDPATSSSFCIRAALSSTVALDGLLGPPYMTRRPRLTNIHGTAAA